MLTELCPVTSSSDEFEQDIKSVCERAFERANSLRSALQACEGLFPTIAVSQFRALDKGRTERWIEQAASEAESQNARATNYPASFFLSTWDFCAEELEIISLNTMKSVQRTCLLGVPSLAPFLSRVSESRPHVLIDLRVRSTNCNKSVICLSLDINSLDGRELSESFDLCFLDPPWYIKNYIKWIDIAGEYCREGGTIAFALLGRLTRPTAVSDREQILEHCRLHGLTVEIQKDLVLYDPPSFERHMLWRAGIPPVPWKRADLVIAKRDHWNASLRDIPQSEPLRPFRQVEIFGILVDIIFDRYQAVAKDLLTEPLGGYWMETPSRRVPGLSDCNVFTSNGAKFISPRPVDLFAALSSFEASNKLVRPQDIELLGFPMDVFSESRDLR